MMENRRLLVEMSEKEFEDYKRTTDIISKLTAKIIEIQKENAPQKVRVRGQIDLCWGTETIEVLEIEKWGNKGKETDDSIKYEIINAFRNEARIELNTNRIKELRELQNKYEGLESLYNNIPAWIRRWFS